MTTTLTRRAIPASSCWSLRCAGRPQSDVAGGSAPHPRRRIAVPLATRRRRARRDPQPGAASRPGLGTSWGEQVNAPISFTPFVRASTARRGPRSRCTTTTPRAFARTPRTSARRRTPLEVYAGDGALVGRARRRRRPRRCPAIAARPHARDRRGRRALPDRRPQRDARRASRSSPRSTASTSSTASPPIRIAAATSSIRTTTSSSTASAPPTTRSPRSASARSPTRTPRRPRAIATSASSAWRSSPSAAPCGRRTSCSVATPPIRSRSAATRRRLVSAAARCRASPGARRSRGS